MSLWHFVTISLGRVGVKAIMDNVTKYDVFLSSDWDWDWEWDWESRIENRNSPSADSKMPGATTHP